MHDRKRKSSKSKVLREMLDRTAKTIRISAHSHALHWTEKPRHIRIANLPLGRIKAML